MLRCSSDGLCFSDLPLAYLILMATVVAGSWLPVDWTAPPSAKRHIRTSSYMKKLILALSIAGLASCTTAPKKEACSSCCKAGEKAACETPAKSKMGTATSLAKKGAAATPQGQAINAASKVATEAKKAQ